jgi:hypothetical protein
MATLGEIAPNFVEIAHRIVWATVATVDRAGTPRTRILHPIWEFDGSELRGWILTSPQSPKAKDLEANPRVSISYWDPTQDTLTADCDVAWEDTPEQRRAGWDRFANGPEPVGYDPSIIPFWPDPDVPEFGVLRLVPSRLRVMPGAVMMQGRAELLQTWRR